ncbi:PHB depolymerase family esterase [Urbifossiella limnaea]|uniref:Alpha/beta hydrolase family protein n=1 Tax=Urbifossiella limnaea TaxID=2528023 RepID=A0A517Y2E8_9BACT|nr:PHB depolymerase family esterase [Urbifossiella limnaea]QDU23941.1 Alpha/beta hydrolase family protein [Urbifossiella limnaea]
MPRTPLLAGLALAVFAGAAPGDVVILKDGFVVQGKVGKEMETIRDPATGQAFVVAKGNGFDFLDDGARVVIFSSHHKQLGEVGKDVKVRPDYRAYRNLFKVRTNNYPPPVAWSPRKTPDFDAAWRRTLELNVPAGFERVDQQVTYLDPYCCFVSSRSHQWTLTYRTSEMDPKMVRKLLSTHPDLVEADGKADPLKRAAIARFQKDAGWLKDARDELAALAKANPGPYAKEAQEEVDKVTRELDHAEAEYVAVEAEVAVAAGRYERAGLLFRAFPEKTADPKSLDRLTTAKARWETARDQYALGKRLLTAITDDLTGAGKAAPFVAAGGGLARFALPTKIDAKTAALAAAAETVAAELHPDSAGRIEFFVNLAAQAEKERAAGKPPTRNPAELLATAISGWAKGKTGATPDPVRAQKVWNAREAALEYQRGANVNARNAALTKYQQASTVGLDELAQVIALLPPAEPENLSARTGEAVKAGPNVPDNVYRRTSAPHGQRPVGVGYCVRLPAEYHHGRAYPVVVMCTYPGVKPEEFLGSAAADADRHGYILVAPDWAAAFGNRNQWEWKGEDHDLVTEVLRDTIRHFTVDTDRVFLMGAGEGADMAMDVGASHPDLFAGVVAVCPNPKWQGLFINYWKNAQKLPFYVVSGQLAGDANQNLRYLYERWTANGFPAIQVVYKGRGIEWYPAEVPVMFDWMGRKRRANGTATLQFGGGARYGWQTNRETDNRFYWLGADRIAAANLTNREAPNRNVTPAELMGDIKGNNLLELRGRGVRTISVWLGRDMIDWSKPVRVNLNGSPAVGWRPRVLEPDAAVMLEDYYQRGDRRMLYLARLEFQSPY